MLSIRRQTLVPLCFLALVIASYTSIALALRFAAYYYNERYEDADRTANFAVSELTSYTQIEWLLDYWERHAYEMELIYDINDERFATKERIIRLKCPGLTELRLMSDGELKTLDAEGQKIYAELCYCRLSQAFDWIKTVYGAYYLYCMKLRPGGDELMFMVTGAKPGEVRGLDSGDDGIFQLGSTIPYVRGDNHDTLDKVIETGQDPDSFDISGEQGDRSVTDTYEPINVNGKLIGIVGVSILTDDLMEDMLGLAKVVFFRTIISMFVLLIIVATLLWIHTLRPIRKEQRIIKKYERDKDHKTAQEELETINSRNELQQLAGSFSSMIGEIDRYMNEVVVAAKEKERSSAELAVAARIQAGALPERHFELSGPGGVSINAIVNPAREVAGDFYDHFRIDDDHIGISVADVSDKGVPASLFMMLSKTLIKNVAIDLRSPAGIIERVNRQLCENNPEGMFVTVWFGIYCISEGKLAYINAGHEHPVVYRKAAGRYELIVEPHDPVLGYFEDHEFTERVLELQPGDKVFLYTDGIPEAADADKNMYGTDRMTECLNRNSAVSGDAVLDAMIEDTAAFVGEAPQYDDMTMLLLEVRDEQQTVEKVNTEDEKKS